MKTYIRPLIRIDHVFSSFYLLSGSPGKAEKALTNEQGLVNNQYEPDIQQLSKEELFSAFSLSDGKTEWSE